MQTSTGVDTNGIINLYQEIPQPDRIKNAYRYHGSPVNNNGSTFTIGGVLRDGRINQLSTSSIGDAINFVSTNDGAQDTGSTSISKLWLYTLNSSTNQWEFKGDTGSINVGDGHLMKMPGDTETTPQRYIYHGQPNNGDLSVSVGANQGVILGNPYPSSIGINSFIEDNDEVIDGTIYFFEHLAGDGHDQFTIEGAYTGINKFLVKFEGVSFNVILSSEPTTDPGTYIPVGQGFYVQTNNSGNITFNNLQRGGVNFTEGAVQFKARKLSSTQQQSSFELSSFKIGMEIEKDDPSKGYLTRTLILGYGDQFTDAYDNGWDARLFDEYASLDTYFQTADNKQSILAVGYERQLLPLTLKTDEDRNFTFSLDQKIEGMEYKIYDQLSNVYYDFTDNPATILISTGTHTNRYYLSVTNKSSTNLLAIENVDSKYEYYVENDILILDHKKQVVENQVLDLSGKLIEKSTSNKIDVKGLEGVFLIKSKFENDEFICQKIILN